MSVSVRPIGGVRLLARHEYEEFFGLLVLGLLLLSTLDETALAPIGRAISLACFALLTIANPGAALGLYIGAASIFSVHHYQGQGSWVERPDNYALLALAFYLLAGRAIGRSLGQFGSLGLAVGLLLLTSLAHMASQGNLDAYHVSWFLRMFGVPLLLFVLLRRAALNFSELSSLLFILAALTVYLSLMSSFEALHWYALIIPPWVGDTFVNPALSQERVGGLLMQPEWNALVLSLGLCVLLGLPGRRKALGHIAWLGGGLLCLVAIYLTYTRAAWLGLLVGGLPWFWYASSNRGVTLKRRMIFVAFVCLMAAVTVLFPSSVTSSRMSDVGTVYYRLQIWAAGFRMLVQHPLFGVGFGEFINHVGGYEQLSQIPQVNDPAGLGDLAHNTFLSVAAELGLIGFGLYLAVIWKTYKAAREGAARFWGEKGSSWVAAFTLVYYANVMFVTAHELVPNVIYFSVMGAIAGYAHSTPRRSRTKTTPPAAAQRSI